MSVPKLWHNPKCSKSRQAVALLKEQGIDFEEVRYMDTPPTVGQLNEYLEQINKRPLEVMRTKEAIFKELGLVSASDEQLIEAMAANPKLIERPVLFAKGKAVIGRPTEDLLTIL